MRARRGARVFTTGVYKDVHDPSKAERNTVLRSIYKLLKTAPRTAELRTTTIIYPIGTALATCNACLAAGCCVVKGPFPRTLFMVNQAKAIWTVFGLLLIRLCQEYTTQFLLCRIKTPLLLQSRLKYCIMASWIVLNAPSPAAPTAQNLSAHVR